MTAVSRHETDGDREVAAERTGRTTGSGTWVRRILVTLAVIAAVVALWRVGYAHLKDAGAVESLMRRAGDQAWIAPLFVAVYTGAVALALPLTPLSLAAGAIFGVVKGSLLVWISSGVGATVGYWLARFVGARTLRRLREKHAELFEKLRRSHGFLAVLRLQLLPFFPFGIVNVAVAIAKVPFLPFLGATLLGVIPGTIAYVYIGDRIRAGFGGDGQRAVVMASAAAAALLLLSFVPTVLKRRRARGTSS